MPKGIPYIIGNELAERFSFYGMKKETYGLEGKKLVPMRRGLTVEIFEKHQMLEELLEDESHFKYCPLSRDAIQTIIKEEYLPESRKWQKDYPQKWSEIQGCN